MSEFRPTDLGETPALEVRIYRDGIFVDTKLCESEEDAAAVVEAWEQQRGISCEVADLSAERHDVDVLEVEPVEIEDRPAAAEDGSTMARQW